MMFEKILVPLDGSELAQRAVEVGADLARRYGAEMHLVQAFAVPVMTPQACAVIDLAAIRADQEAAVRSYLESQKPEGVSCQIHAVAGEPATSVLDLADSLQIDLIVLTTHGRSGLDRWLFGSVAERVVRHAHCPVMTIGRQSLTMANPAS